MPLFSTVPTPIPPPHQLFPSSASSLVPTAPPIPLPSVPPPSFHFPPTKITLHATDSALLRLPLATPQQPPPPALRPVSPSRCVSAVFPATASHADYEWGRDNCGYG